MARQFKYSKHSDESDYSENGKGHGLIAAPFYRRTALDAVLDLLFFRQDSGQRNEIGNDGHDVDDVHHVFEKVALIGATNDSHDNLERKPHYAYSLDEEERVCKIGHFVLFNSSSVVGCIEQFVVFKLWQCLQAKDDDRQQDDNH